MSTITDPQRSFITSLLTSRLTTLGMPDLATAEVALNLDSMSKEDASTIIGRLKAMPEDPDPRMPPIVARSSRHGTGNRLGPCVTCRHPVQPNTGYYFLDDTTKAWKVVHAVGECNLDVIAPAPLVLKEGVYVVDGTFILVYRTRNGRLAGKVWNGRSFQYQQGAVSLASMGRFPTAEEAATFGLASGRCCACGHNLEDGRSTKVGYGPVCAGKYGWPWGAK